MPVNQHAVGLQVIFNCLSTGAVLLLKLDDLFEEPQAEQCRLSSLPGKDYLLKILPFDILPDEFFQNVIRHLFRW